MPVKSQGQGAHISPDERRALTMWFDRLILPPFSFGPNKMGKLKLKKLNPNTG